MNYKQMLSEYCEFMQWTFDENITQEQAEEKLINDLEYMIGTNGIDWLYQIEKDLINKVGGCSVCGSIPMTVNCNNAECDK